MVSRCVGKAREFRVPDTQPSEGRPVGSELRTLVCSRGQNPVGVDYTSGAMESQGKGRGRGHRLAFLARRGQALRRALAGFTDFETLATILQHCACVVANAGTILLEAVVNDRPAVCVLYDEGAPPGEDRPQGARAGRSTARR